MKLLTLAMLCALGAYGQQCVLRPNPETGLMDCAGGSGGGATAGTPYTSSTANGNSVTITGVSHGKGTAPIWTHGSCFNTATRVAIPFTSFAVAANGDVTGAWATVQDYQCNVFAAAGSPGIPGSNGTSATVAVGTTTTGTAGTSASVANGGTSSAAVLNFTIPRGADGISPQSGPGINVSVDGTVSIDHSDGTPVFLATYATAGAPTAACSLTPGPSDARPGDSAYNSTEVRFYDCTPTGWVARVAFTGTLTSGKQLAIDNDFRIITSPYDVGAAGGGGGGSVDPLTTLSWIEDFCGGTTGTGTVGSTGWGTQNGGLSYLSPAVTGHPCIFRKSTSATANITSTIYFPGSSQAAFQASETFDLRFVYRLNNADAETTTRLGITCSGAISGTLQPADGMYFERTAAQSNWFAVTRAVSTPTSTDSGVAASTSWLNLRVRRVNSSTIGFTLNGGTEITHTTNIPTGGCSVWAVINNTVAADKSHDFDLVVLTISGLSR